MFAYLSVVTRRGVTEHEMPLSRANYCPSKYNSKKYCGPYFVHLNQRPVAVGNTTDKQFVRIRKRLGEFSRVTQLPDFDLTHVVLALGTPITQDAFVTRHINRLPCPTYRPAADNDTDDGDIVVTGGSAKLSLRDPMTFARIKLPVRGAECDHLECFDLTVLLSSANERPLTFDWRCPVCSILMPGIHRDREYATVLLKYQKQLSVNEVPVDLEKWGKPGYTP
eukprot:NODE_5383_length_951_cov_53.745169_g5167_i0.p1 GENE.NODE_5383_length_951_cov_53.745169_g5167_i0~~NODE_5383_length_951_cov_53.745169_g5167_i0.p1  ORF type:complete len:253 (-),score=10.52 NODE_5383_length_951_cov_53.745169_g5167_i0:191-859(-)